MSADLKQCHRCARLLPLDEFSVRDRDRGTRRNVCKTCQATYARAHYRQHRDGYIARRRARAQRERERNRAVVLEHLLANPCIDCGERDIVVLQFDHRDGEQKTDEISRLIFEGSEARLREEMEKCDVRCANCHRRRTARQFNWRRLLGEPMPCYRVAIE